MGVNLTNLENSWEQYQKDITELRKYGEHEGTELGEWTLSLCDLAERETPFGWEDNIKDMVTEMLYHFKQTFEWVEEEQETPAKVKVFKRLKYIG